MVAARTGRGGGAPDVPKRRLEEGRRRFGRKAVVPGGGFGATAGKSEKAGRAGGQCRGGSRESVWSTGSANCPDRFISRRKSSWLIWRRVQCVSPTLIPAR